MGQRSQGNPKRRIFMKKDVAPPTVLSVTVLAVSLFGDALVI
jgi:hypothetical protein